METRNIINYLGQVVGELSLPQGTPEEVWQSKLAPYLVPPVTEEEQHMSAAIRKWEYASEFAKRVVAVLQNTADEYGFSDEQRVWLQHRLRAVDVEVFGQPAVVDMLNLVVSGEAKAALFATRQMQPDALDQPYHCVTAELIYGLKAMLLDFLGLPAEEP